MYSRMKDKLTKASRPSTEGAWLTKFCFISWLFPCLHLALHVLYSTETEKVTNEVLKKAKFKKRLYKIIQTKKLKPFDHIIHQHGDTLKRRVLDGTMNGCRERERLTTASTNITDWIAAE